MERGVVEGGKIKGGKKFLVFLKIGELRALPGGESENR